MVYHERVKIKIIIVGTNNNNNRIIETILNSDWFRNATFLKRISVYNVYNKRVGLVYCGSASMERRYVNIIYHYTYIRCTCMLVRKKINKKITIMKDEIRNQKSKRKFKKEKEKETLMLFIVPNKKNRLNFFRRPLRKRWVNGEWPIFTKLPIVTWLKN